MEAEKEEETQKSFRGRHYLRLLDVRSTATCNKCNAAVELFTSESNHRVWKKFKGPIILG